MAVFSCHTDYECIAGSLRLARIYSDLSRVQEEPAMQCNDIIYLLIIQDTGGDYVFPAAVFRPP